MPTTDRLDWSKLLDARRLREIHAHGSSYRMPGDARSELERDYGRAVFCTPVRRLHDKAQVFPLDPHDSVRTRLTHSLEVSTLARSLARRIARWLITNGEIANDDSTAIEDVVATAALLHDLGNPPFGHAGEGAIQTWFENRTKESPTFLDFGVSRSAQDQMSCDFLRFEGNAQTLRLIARLQFISDRYGLNLTIATLSATRKYSAASNALDPKQHEKRKPGHFYSEQALVDELDELTGTHGARNPLAYLVEACDDIVYCLVDMEDGVKKGVISWEQLEAELGVIDVAVEALAKAKKYVDRDLTHAPRERGEHLTQMFRTFTMTPLLNQVEQAFCDNYEAIMCRSFHGDLIAANASSASFIEAVKAILRGRIFSSSAILNLEVMGQRVIHDLLTSFWGAVAHYAPNRKLTDFDEKLYRLLSPNYRAVFETTQKGEGLPGRYAAFQLVTDYVSGMTDSFACSLHRTLRNA